VPSIDPDASVIMALSAQQLADREVIRSQQETIIALCAILKAQERSVHVLTYLVADLLDREPK
jgi:hypothetical protein